MRTKDFKRICEALGYLATFHTNTNAFTVAPVAPNVGVTKYISRSEVHGMEAMKLNLSWVR